MPGMVRIGELEAAGDLTTAALVREDGSQSQQAVDERVAPAAAAYLASDPAVADAAAAAADTAVDEKVDSLQLVQVDPEGTSDGFLQRRFTANGALGWYSDTSTGDPALNTTLPGPPTTAAFVRVGFGRTTPGPKVPGVGVRGLQDRPSARDLSDSYDIISGTVGPALDAAIALGHVGPEHAVTSAALCALVPVGRSVIHQPIRGRRPVLIIGERTA